MNQPRIRYRECKCIKCHINNATEEQIYDTRLSDWVVFREPICKFCRYDGAIFLQKEMRINDQSKEANK